MALISCKECNSEISSTAVSCPKCGAPNTPEEKLYVPIPVAKNKRGLWKWIIGIPVGLFVFVMVFGTIAGNTPEGKDKARARDAIDYCWSIQSKKSLDPGAARFAAGACEKLERDFRDKFGYTP